MRIAYIILAHHLPDQVIRLVRTLNEEFATFFIHYDRKARKNEFMSIRQQLKDQNNVHFLPRIYTHWGDFSCVAATMNGINAILESDIYHDYAVLLTGQCYPIKSNRYIHDFLNKIHDMSVMENFNLPSERWENGGLPRFQSYWIIRYRRRLEIKMKRCMPSGLIPYGGSAYWCLSHEACRYVSELLKKKTQITRFFKHVRYPDEMFFQTILKNSPFSELIINDDMRYIDWSRLPTPAILIKEDLDSLGESQDLFARKFDTRVDKEVLNLIDIEILRNY